MSTMQVLATGLRFPEGPIALGDGSVLVVEIARRTLSRVLPDGTVEVVADCGGGPNGAAFGPDGRVYVCNNGGMPFFVDDKGRTRIGEGDHVYLGGSIQAVDLATGEVETIYTEVDGRPLSAPNDIVFDATGGFWFTDLGKTRDRSRDHGGVYYARPDGSSVTEVIHPLDTPNGVGLAPGDGTLYVAETITGRVRAWDLSGPGTIDRDRDPRGRGRLLAGLPGEQLLDSMAVDAEGHVCVATIRNGGITVIAEDGTVDHVPSGDPLTTNICFGGPDLRTAYITASLSGVLLSTTWARPGLPLHFTPG